MDILSEMLKIDIFVNSRFFRLIYILLKCILSDFVVVFFVETSVLYRKRSISRFATKLNGLKCYILKKAWFDEERCSNSCYSQRTSCLFYRHKENVFHNTRNRIIRQILRLFISILLSYSEFKLCCFTLLLGYIGFRIISDCFLFLQN